MSPPEHSDNASHGPDTTYPPSSPQPAYTQPSSSPSPYTRNDGGAIPYHVPDGNRPTYPPPPSALYPPPPPLPPGLPPTFHYRPPEFYIPPETPFRKKRRRCLYMYYVLRQAALVFPFVSLVLTVNIYVSRRGRYLNDDTDSADPVYYPMWLTVPLNGLVFLWAIINLLCLRRAHYRGGIPYQMQFGVELLFALASVVCFVLLVMNMVEENDIAHDVYPYHRYEVPLACLLGLLMITQWGLVARALFEVNVEKKRREVDSVVSV
ncbi:hypothetical protein SODALDRAFT_4980 [Sodiomyces alkalinus F11]|uniref:MARVEL domain-containing protein n=1 Tax=Sodiomyces alkalinus (strain CBS 110278 / VKM F-3762 / F11) TaxID=1314773 RepID=A0A3N2Q5F7_SODAK|nr:hypothetical protein SODALDRAFT_4980 [Sodiomyces alkalinus F11]ROT42000.1 hypothetical protein SODALDRAFT_4980 [Sodiomyces alkalinus F11]